MSHSSEDVFAGLKILSEIGIRLVPEHPTGLMCAAGISAGDVDIETVRRVYYAMLVAASHASLHGDAPLN